MASRFLKIIKLFIIAYGLICARKIILKIYYEKYKRLPPTRFGLPLFGCFLELIKNPDKFLILIGKTYPDICSVQIGRKLTIFVNNSSFSHEILKKECSLNRPKRIAYGRPKDSRFLSRVNGLDWQTRRKYGTAKLFRITNSDFLSNAVDYSLNNYIYNIINNCIHNNKLWYPNKSVRYITFNTIFMALFGVNMSINDPFFNEWIYKLVPRFVKSQMKLQILDMLGITLPEWIIWKYCDLKSVINDQNKLITNWMEQNGYIFGELSGDVHYSPQMNVKVNENCFVHSMINDVINEEESTYKSPQLIIDILVYLFAGFDTTANSAEYGLLLLCKYIDIQEQLYNELKSVYNCDSDSFTFSKINKLHLFRAFIYDALRMANVVPMGLPHCTNKSFVIGKYKYMIPKDSTIIINDHFIHTYNDEWDNNLHINKWLDENGKFKINENFLIFGSGKRDCVGRNVAISQLYALFAKLILNYKFSFGSERNVKDDIQQKFGQTKRVWPEVGIKVQNRNH
eukprot:300968_1